MAVSSKCIRIGVIAEDDSDVKVLEAITEKIISKNSFSIKKMVGRGCAQLRRKCSRFARNLKDRDCSVLVVIHDLDRASEPALRQQLEKSIGETDFLAKIVLLPVEELEAWLLSDPEAIKLTFNMGRLPKIPVMTHTIPSPKEYLERLVRQNSKSRYVNTIHNHKIARNLKLENIMRCPSFCPYPSLLESISEVCASS